MHVENDERNRLDGDSYVQMKWKQNLKQNMLKGRLNMQKWKYNFKDSDRLCEVKDAREGSAARGETRLTATLYANGKDGYGMKLEASVEESRELKHILQKYEEASGQKINTDTQETKDEILATLGPMQDTRHTRYFPTGDILNAKLGNSPSYSWRSIHSSLEVIRRRTRWRVGNKKLIHIWDDKWLPTPSTYKAISPPNNNPQFLMVSSLIDPMTNWWRVNLVRATFLPFEVDTILKIPLSHDLPEDKIIWLGNRRRVFTVKSVYHIALNLLNSMVGEECSNGDPCKPIWKKLWHLNLLAKIKIFAWRACVNGLPTMEAIYSRGISQTKSCPMCGNVAENLDHALLDCTFSSSVWSLWSENPLSTHGIKKSFLDSILYILSHATLQDLELFFAIAWAVWFNRNRVHKNNVNGASSESDCSSSIGVVIRDSLGQVVAALCKPLQACFPAELTKIMAVEQGVVLAQELQLPRVIVESDSSNVIQAIQEKATGSSFGHIIQRILQTCESFESCFFKHLSRNFNSVAHELAQHARRSNSH
nr:hypothetical protein CFP56_06853 [Quercus suber]